MSDGMFLSACREVAKEFPSVTYDEDLLDRVCLKASIMDRWRLHTNSVLDCDKPCPVLWSCHGYAQLVWRYPVRYVCRIDWWSGFDTFRKYWQGKIIRSFSIDVAQTTFAGCFDIWGCSRFCTRYCRWVYITIVSPLQLPTFYSGKGLANPTALLLSSLMMLRYVLQLRVCTSPQTLFRHMNLNDYADKIEKAALTVRFAFCRRELYWPAFLRPSLRARQSREIWEAGPVPRSTLMPSSRS